MLGALAQIVPERVPAAGEGGNSVICISGLQAQPQALHHRRHDLRRLGRPARQGRAGGRHQRLAEPLQHAGRGDGGRASRCAWRNTPSCPTPAARANGAAAWGCGAPIASWRPRRCCRCAPTAWCSSPTGSSGGAAGRPLAQLHRDRQQPRAAAGQGDDDRAAGRRDRPRAGGRRRLRRSHRRATQRWCARTCSTARSPRSSRAGTIQARWKTRVKSDRLAARRGGNPGAE